MKKICECLKVFVLLLTVGNMTAVQAQVYRCPDAGGQAVFQDRPCDTASASQTGVEPESQKHFLWQASAGKGRLSLLGSIHFGRADMYPLPRVMTSKFRQAEALVVEADVVNINPFEMAQLVAEKAMYGPGESLQQSLTPATWQQLSQAVRKLGISAELLNNQKPWFASMTVTGLALRQMGFSEGEGIDQHFIKMARGKKRLIELEGIAWQLALFDQFTEAEQIGMLEETLKELEYGPEYFEKMLAYWRSGDQAGIQQLFDEGAMNQTGGEQFTKLIITDRNKRMVAKLHELAKQGGDYFVVVGAGHLTGPEGIVALLEKRGYTIEQL